MEKFPGESAESLQTNRFCCSVLRHLFRNTA